MCIRCKPISTALARSLADNSTTVAMMSIKDIINI